jgi:type I restriction enzyme M protein
MTNLYTNAINELPPKFNRKDAFELFRLMKLVEMLDSSLQHDKLDYAQLLKEQFIYYKLDNEIQIKLHQWIKLMDLETIESHQPRVFLNQKTSASKELESLVASILSKKQKVLDYCSGEGSFLIEYGKLYPQADLHGIEIDKDAYISSIVSLKLNGYRFKVFNEDALTPNSLFKLDYKFDAIFCNFPINLANKTGDYWHEHQSYLTEFKFDTKGLRTQDWDFISHAVNLLSEDGIAVIVVPLSMLFRKTEASVRDQLLEYGLLESIIQLPEKMLSYDNIPIALMVLSRQNNQVKFVDASKRVEIIPSSKKSEIKPIEISELLSFENTIDIDYTYLKYGDSNWIPRNLILKNEFNFEGQQLSSLVLDIFRGAQISKDEYENNLMPGENENLSPYHLIQLAGFDETIDYESATLIYTARHQLDRYLVQENDILITSRGTMLKMALATNVQENFVITGNIAIIRANPDKINPRYLYLFLKSPLGQQLLESIRQGSGIYIFNNKDIAQLKIKVPSQEKQDELARRYLDLMERKTFEEQRLRKLENEIETLYDLSGNQ